PIDAPKKRSIIGQLLAGAIIVMGGLNLLLYRHDVAVLGWLVMSPLADGSLVEVNGARISLGFVLIGASLLSLNWKTARGFRPAELACAVIAVIAILSVVAYSHYLIGFYTTGIYTPASLLTSVSFFLLATGTLLARADRGTLAIIVSETAAGRASQAKDDFLAVLSHELRTPLTPALAAASYLAEHEDLSPQLREEVTAIRTSVQLEARLIDDLLDLTRITRGKIELHLEVVDVHGLLRNSLEIARDNILEKQLDLVVDFGAERHHVWADAVRLQQVFWNLINNAVKFTKKNGRI